jgi:hypothetical protein
MHNPFRAFVTKRSKSVRLEQDARHAAAEDQFRERLSEVVERGNDQNPPPHAPGEKPSEGGFGKKPE